MIFSFFSFTGSVLTFPVRRASHDSCSGQTTHFGDWGVHWIAPKSMMAWL